MIYIHVKDKELELLAIQEKKKKIVVKKAIRIPLSSQLVVNGFVQDEDVLFQELASIVRRKKLRKQKVVLTIDSTFLVYRELTTPILGKKQLDAFVYHNLKSQINTIEEHVIDYAILQKDKNLQLLAIAAPTSLIEPYQRILKKTGVSLHAITTSPLNLIRGYELMDKSKKLASQIYVYFNGEIINSVLFNHGSYVLANAFRTFGSTSVQVSIMERISQLMQFQKAQNNGLQVEKVNIYGHIEPTIFEEMASLLKISIVSDEFTDIIQNSTGLSLHQSMSNVFASLYSTYKNYNLASGINQSQFTVKHQEKKTWSLVLVLLVINILVVTGAGTYLYYLRQQASQHKRELQVRLENPILINKYFKSLELTGLNTVYEKQFEEVNAVLDTLADQKAFHHGLYESVMSLKPNDVSMTSLSYIGESVVVSLSAQKRESTYEYVRRLRDSELFYDVSYTGFQFNESTKRYEYQVSLLLKVGVVDETN